MAGSNIAVQHGQIEVDNDLFIFAREQLTKTMERASNRVYPSLKIATGQLMPVVTIAGYEWEDRIVVFEFDSFGIATVLASGAQDGGRVGIVARKMEYQIRTISDWYEVSWEEMQKAKAKNISISQRYADALKMGMDKKIDDIGYNGDPDYGLQGLFTSQIPRLTAATTLAAAANPDAMLAILNGMVSAVVSNTNTVWTPKLMVMPLTQQQLIANTYRATASDMTVLDAFLASQKKLGQIQEVIVDNKLKGKGDSGTDALLVLPFDARPNDDTTAEGFDEEVDYPIYFALPLDMTVPPEFEQLMDVMYRNRAIARTGGVVVQEPLTALIGSGI